MIIFPAIDLKQGQCVRLEKGDMAKATIFNENPSAQVEVFCQAGFEWLHLIDLDGATEQGNNKKIIAEILTQKKLKTQIGGGIRSLAQVEALLEAGAQRVILGTLALTQPEIAKQACQKFPTKIVIALDGLDGKVAIQGWKKISDEKIIDVAARVEAWGAAAILFTDIARDGMGEGINIAATINLAQKTSIPIIASGGLKSIKDIEALKEEKNIEGVIAGRALYDGSLNGARALQAVKENA